MLFPQKTQYALRALFELSCRHGSGPIKIAQIAEAQSIPVRFLEGILNQLKQGGFVESTRGKEGGYFLSRPPEQITVGQLFRYVQGDFQLVDCMTGQGDCCPLNTRCVFRPVWDRAGRALGKVFDETTLQGLVEEARQRESTENLSYCI